MNLKILLLGHTNTKKTKITQNEIEYLSNVVWKNDNLNKYIEDKISIQDGNILDKIKKCNKNFDDKLLNDIVQVGETQNI